MAASVVPFTGRNPWRVCPRCGMDVYKSRWHDHDRRCLLVSAAFGRPQMMAAAFRGDTRLTPESLARKLPRTGVEFITAVLLACGVTEEEIAERVNPAQGAVGLPAVRYRDAVRCRRCQVLRDAPGVRPWGVDPSLCAWCAEDLRVRPSAALAPAGQGERA